MTELRIKRTFQDVIGMSELEQYNFLCNIYQLLSFSISVYTFVRVSMFERPNQNITNSTIKELRDLDVLEIVYNGVSVDVKFYNYSTVDNFFKLKTSRDNSDDFDLNEIIKILTNSFNALKKDVKDRKEINLSIVKHFFKINK